MKSRFNYGKQLTLGLGLIACMVLPVQAAEQVQGLLVFGHEARTLQRCDDTRTYWVSAPEVLRRQLASDYQGLATRPYEPVYARLKGEFVDQPATGFAADYDGTFEVHQILSVSREKSANSESIVNSEAKTYVFVCEDQSAYTVRATENEAWLFRPEGTLKLSSVPTENGARYSDGSFKLRIKGQQAELGEIGGTLISCRNDRRRAIWEKAKLEGADFRAVGNEPGWNLEIREGRRIV
ncbi:MAG: lysozyme inhibitor, partial [Gammaproteobacteria bacterium]|nr:lysozyme inhibitor [Gammaproteobacteria bacterium]